MLSVLCRGVAILVRLKKLYGEGIDERNMLVCCLSCSTVSVPVVDKNTSFKIPIGAIEIVLVPSEAMCIYICLFVFLVCLNRSISVPFL